MKLVFMVLITAMIGLGSYHSTLALFSDTAASSGNVFSASTEFPVPTPVVANHVVFSEIQVAGGNANQDFVELYNPTSTPVNLTGWSIRKKNSAGTDSSLALISAGTIPAYGYFLWSNDQGTFETDIGANISNGNTLSENNSVALRDNNNITIDQVAWGSTTNPQYLEGFAFPSSPNTNSSIERKSKSSSITASMASGGSDEFKGNGFDSDNNSTDFVLRTVSQPQNSSSPIEIP
jgi:large repetitive protein